MTDLFDRKKLCFCKLSLTGVDYEAQSALKKMF